jgi:preprotein translocase subunit SecF
LTTLIVVVTLFLFGGGAINDFALVMLAGVVVGTYSSIFVASAVIASWHHRVPTRAKSV